MRRLPIVAIVAGADAQAALGQFFGAISPPSGMAFVVMHGAVDVVAPQTYPGFETVRVTERMPLVGEHVYFLPAGRHVSLAGDAIYPMGMQQVAGEPADSFLRTLASARGAHAVAVVLGTPASDGLPAVCAVEEHGGLVAADSSQIAVSHVVAPARELASVVVNYARQLFRELEVGTVFARSEALPDIEALAARVLPEGSALPAVLVDYRGRVLYVSGRTGNYLEPPPGYANWNIYAMARPGLRDALLYALPEAFRSGQRVTRRRLLVDTDDAVGVVDLIVEPICGRDGESTVARVAFVETARREAEASAARVGG